MSAAVVTQQIYRLTPASRTDVCVDLGRLERLVAEERLDDTQVGAAVEEFGRKDVTEDMRVKPDARGARSARSRGWLSVATAASAWCPSSTRGRWRSRFGTLRARTGLRLRYPRSTSHAPKQPSSTSRRRRVLVRHRSVAMCRW